MDRNTPPKVQALAVGRSLSARRAWIEIGLDWRAPRYAPRSLSARRAWIEKTLRLTLYLSIMVALRKESVDRNLVMWTRCPSTTSRSPQGERG